MDTTTTNYTLDLNNRLTQVLTDGTDTYLYGLGRIGEFDGTDWTYPLADALGSVRQLTDASGAPVLAQNYAPYGDVLESYGDASSNYGFAGEWTDGTGLQHLRARYLNTGIGRFISRDSWGGDYNRPLSLNRWAYVEGNPVNRVDPSGYCGANRGSGSDEKTKQCIQMVEAIESAYRVTIYWPDRNYLPNGVPNNITCFCMPGVCENLEWATNNVDYKKWKLHEVVAIGASLAMYQAELGANALGTFMDGVVFTRVDGRITPSGVIAGGYYLFSDPNFNGPNITLTDYNIGLGEVVWVITHEIAHHFTGFGGDRLLGLADGGTDSSFKKDIWGNSEDNPKTGPTNESRNKSLREDMADSITTYMWAHHADLWLQHLSPARQEIQERIGNRDKHGLTQDRNKWIEDFFDSIRSLYP